MKYFNLLFVALVVIFATACKENNLNTPDLNSQEEKISLPMTRWTLQGIFDTKTQKLQQLAPVDERTYSINFGNDTSALMYSVSNCMQLSLRGDNILQGAMTKVYDETIGDCKLFYATMDKVERYEFQGKLLKLYFDNGEKYMLYKFLRKTTRADYHCWLFGPEEEPGK